MAIEQDIFKNGSTTYYFSSRFFPKKVREDVFRFYSFVRIADDYVDSVPQKVREFRDLRSLWNASKNNLNFDTRRRADDTLNLRVIKNIVYICRTYDCDQAWVEAFFDAMQSDLEQRRYQTIKDSLSYVYGSAEVIGLFMTKILRLPDAAQPYARLQGRAMQFVNFIRDIEEDNHLGRCYFPITELKHFGLTSLSKSAVNRNPGGFKKFVYFQIERYRKWQSKAQVGFEYIPPRFLVPLQTAVDMYNWTADEIERRPFVVYERKVKPTKRQVFSSGISKTVRRNKQ